MADQRLPAQLEVSGIIRAVQAEGGFATVLQKGEQDAGTLLIITTQGGRGSELWERMPQLDGSRRFIRTKSQDKENKEEFENYLRRRQQQDPDLWLIELDIAGAERFIDSKPG